MASCKTEKGTCIAYSLTATVAWMRNGWACLTADIPQIHGIRVAVSLKLPPPTTDKGCLLLAFDWLFAAAVWRRDHLIPAPSPRVRV